MRNSAQRFLVIVIATALVMGSYTEAQKVSASELQFREALRKQEVEGDLQAAIKLFKDIVDSKTAERAVKARALWQLAACYEKQGQESQAIYQRIVNEFGEQPAAKEARAKIAALRPPAPNPTATLRVIEFNSNVQNVVATDGQRAVYWDSTNTLFISDVSGKKKLKVREVKQRPSTVVSRDLSMVFFYFPGSTASKVPGHYAVVKTDGTGYRELRLIENGAAMPSDAPRCLDWSWD